METDSESESDGPNPTSRLMQKSNKTMRSDCVEKRPMGEASLSRQGNPRSQAGQQTSGEPSGTQVGRTVSDFDTSSSESDGEELLKKEDGAASAHPLVETRPKKNKRNPRRKRIHQSRKTMTQLSAQEAERVLKIISSPDVEIPLKLQKTYDLASDLEKSGINSWIYLNVIKTGHHKDKHKQKTRFLFNLKENEKLKEAINEALLTKRASSLTFAEDTEEEPDAAGNVKDKEDKQFFFHVSNLEEYLDNALYPEREDNGSLSRMAFATRASYLQPKSGAAPSTSAEPASTSATANTSSTSASTSSYGTVQLSDQIEKLNLASYVHDVE